MEIESISFFEISQVWQKYLWPERVSPIEEISYIDHNGEIDMSISQLAKPEFIAIKQGNSVVAVTSFYKTEGNLWRIRGTWVDEQARGKGYGKILISDVVSKIKKQQSEFRLWTMARQPALGFYVKNQFIIGEKIEGYEYGPHFIVTMDVLN